MRLLWALACVAIIFCSVAVQAQEDPCSDVGGELEGIVCGDLYDGDCSSGSQWADEDYLAIVTGVVACAAGDESDVDCDAVSFTIDEDTIVDCWDRFLAGEFEDEGNDDGGDGDYSVCDNVGKDVLEFFCDGQYAGHEVCENSNDESPVFQGWVLSAWGSCGSSASCTESDASGVPDAANAASCINQWLGELDDTCADLQVENLAAYCGGSCSVDVTRSEYEAWLLQTHCPADACTDEYNTLANCFGYKELVGARFECGSRHLSTGDNWFNFNYPTFSLTIAGATSLCVDDGNECTPLESFNHEWGDRAVNEATNSGSRKRRAEEMIDLTAFDIDDWNLDFDDLNLEGIEGTADWDFENTDWDFENTDWDFENTDWDFENTDWDFENTDWDDLNVDWEAGEDWSEDSEDWSGDDFGDWNNDWEFEFDEQEIIDIVADIETPLSDASWALLGAVKLVCDINGETVEFDSVNEDPAQGLPDFFYPIGLVDDPNLYMQQVGEEYRLPVITATSPFVFTGFLVHNIEMHGYRYSYHGLEGEECWDLYPGNCRMEFNDGTWDDWVDINGDTHVRPILRDQDNNVLEPLDSQIFDWEERTCNSDKLADTWLLVLEAISRLGDVESWDEFEASRRVTDVLLSSKHWDSCKELFYRYTDWGERIIKIPETKLCPMWNGAWDWPWDDPCCGYNPDECCVARDVAFKVDHLPLPPSSLSGSKLDDITNRIANDCTDTDAALDILEAFANDHVKDFKCSSESGGDEFWQAIEGVRQDCESKLYEEKECTSEGTGNNCLAGCNSATNKCVIPWTNPSPYLFQCIRSSDSLPTGFIPFLEDALMSRLAEAGEEPDSSLEVDSDEYWGDILLKAAGNEMCTGPNLRNGGNRYSMIKWDPECDDEEHWERYDSICPRQWVEDPMGEEECLSTKQCNWKSCYQSQACIAPADNRHECTAHKQIRPWWDWWQETCYVGDFYSRFECNSFRFESDLEDVGTIQGEWEQPEGCYRECRCVVEDLDAAECQQRAEDDSNVSFTWYDEWTHWDWINDESTTYENVCGMWSWEGDMDEDDCEDRGGIWDYSNCYIPDSDPSLCLTVRYDWDWDICYADSNWDGCPAGTYQEVEGEEECSTWGCWDSGTCHFIKESSGEPMTRKDCEFLALETNGHGDDYYWVHWEEWGEWKDQCVVNWGDPNELKCTSFGFEWVDTCEEDCTDHPNDSFCADCSWGDGFCQESSQFGRCLLDHWNEDACVDAGGEYTNRYSSWGEWECVLTEAETLEDCMPEYACGDLSAQAEDPWFWGEYWCSEACVIGLDGEECQDETSKYWDYWENRCDVHFPDPCSCVSDATDYDSCTGAFVNGERMRDGDGEYLSCITWAEWGEESVCSSADGCHITGDGYIPQEDDNGNEWDEWRSFTFAVDCDLLVVPDCEESDCSSIIANELYDTAWSKEWLETDNFDWELFYIEVDAAEVASFELSWAWVECGYDVEEASCTHAHFHWDEWGETCSTWAGSDEECEGYGGVWECFGGASTWDDARESQCTDAGYDWSCVSEGTSWFEDGDGEGSIECWDWRCIDSAATVQSECEADVTFWWDDWRGVCRVSNVWGEDNCPTEVVEPATVEWISSRRWKEDKLSTEEECTSAGACLVGWDIVDLPEEECVESGSCNIFCPTCAPRWDYRVGSTHHSVCVFDDVTESDCNEENSALTSNVPARDMGYEWDHTWQKCFVRVDSPASCATGTHHSCGALGESQCNSVSWDCHDWWTGEGGCEVNNQPFPQHLLQCSMDPWVSCPKSRCTDEFGECDDWELAAWRESTSAYSSGVCRVPRENEWGCGWEQSWLRIGCADNDIDNEEDCEEEGGEWLERANNKDDCLAQQGCRERGRWELSPKHEEKCTECGGKMESAYNWWGGVWSTGQYTPYTWQERSYSPANSWGRAVNETTFRHIMDGVIARTLASQEASAITCKLTGDWRYLRRLGCLCEAGENGASAICTNFNEEETALLPVPVNEETCEELPITDGTVGMCDDIEGSGTAGVNNIAVDAVANTAEGVAEGEVASTVEEATEDDLISSDSSSDSSTDSSAGRRLSAKEDPRIRRRAKLSRGQRRRMQLTSGRLLADLTCTTYETVLNSNQKIIGQAMGDLKVVSLTGGVSSIEVCVDKGVALTRTAYTEPMFALFANNQLTVESSITGVRETDTQICGNLPSGSWAPVKVVAGYDSYNIAFCGDAAPTPEQNAASKVEAAVTAEVSDSDCSSASSGIPSVTNALASAAGIANSQITATGCSAVSGGRRLAESTVTVEIQGSEDTNAQVAFESMSLAIEEGEVAGVTGAVSTSVDSGCSACESITSTVVTSAEDSGGVAAAAATVTADGTVTTDTTTGATTGTTTVTLGAGAVSTPSLVVTFVIIALAALL